MKLRLRLSLATAAAVTFSSVSIAAAVFYAEREDLLRAADADLRREAEAILLRLDATGPESPVVVQDLAKPYRVHAELVGTDGSLTALEPAGVLVPVSERAVAVALGRADRYYSTIVSDGEQLRMLTSPTTGGALVVTRSMDDVEELINHLAVILGLVVLAALGLAIILGDLVARAAVRPITSLSVASERLARDRGLRERLDAATPDELGRLAGSINSLLDTLDTAQRSQSQLVADAAHELKTPLTTIWTNLELLTPGHGLPGPEVERIQADVRAEVAGLIGAAEDLLELARDEPANALLDDVTLDDLVTGVVADARRSWPSVEFSVAAAPVTVVGTRARIWRAVRNLVDNAAKWSPPGGVVVVRLDENELSVRDHGPGVPPEELPHVFARFYRALTARGLPGAGLGLAIVEKVVAEHGWRVTAENAPGGGAWFRVLLHPAPVPGLTHAAAGPDANALPERAGRLPVWLRSRPALITGAAVLSIASLVALFGLRTVPGSTPETPLVSLAGVLERCGSQYCVGEAVADFGPAWYVTGTGALHDYDGNGRRELLAAELEGLIGSVVSLETDGGELDQDVFTINGFPLRDAVGQLPAPPDPS